MPSSIVNMIVEALLAQIQKLISADTVKQIEIAALQFAMDEIKKLVSIDMIHKLEVELIGQMRLLAKSATPGFPYDDQLVELLAKACGVA